jgi:cell division protein FtsB
MNQLPLRLFAVALLIAALALQYRLWLSDSGIREVRRLQNAVTAQTQQNVELKERNEQLAAEVKDLKEGLDAVEERARSDLGMVGANETFYQVVAPPPADHEAPAPAPSTDSSLQATGKSRPTQQAAAR